MTPKESQVKNLKGGRDLRKRKNQKTHSDRMHIT